MDSASRAEGMFWDNVPLLEDVLSGASDSILLGSNRIGDEEGAFVVHEDVGERLCSGFRLAPFQLGVSHCSCFSSILRISVNLLVGNSTRFPSLRAAHRAALRFVP